jgi:hypothetical protein
MYRAYCDFLKYAKIESRDFRLLVGCFKILLKHTSVAQVTLKRYSEVYDR